MEYKPRRTTYKVGTRMSELALIQTESVIAELHKAYPLVEYGVVKIKTVGDKNLLTPLAHIGDKGLFTKELEIELEGKRIDFIVHSLKDVPSTALPTNMVIGAILERADPRDAVVMSPRRKESSLSELPSGSTIGTSSTRRIAQLKLNYPHLSFKNIRGNMNTRWEKLANEECGYDAMIAAVAGLQRLGWSERIREIIEPDRVLYAIGQGALGIECRHDDHDTLRMLAVLNHPATVIRCIAERAFLRRISGGCSIPNAVRTEFDGKALSIHGILLNLDGSRSVQSSMDSPDLTSPVTAALPAFLVSHEATKPSNRKRKRTGSNSESIAPLPRHYAHVCAINIEAILLENAELCGTNLAVRLLQMGADSILEDIHRTLAIESRAAE